MLAITINSYLFQTQPIEQGNSSITPHLQGKGDENKDLGSWTGMKMKAISSVNYTIIPPPPSH